jgi:hypothetical protein
MMMITDLQIGMSVVLFALGLCSCVAGLWTMLSRKYQQALKSISSQSAKVSSKALTDIALAPLLDGLSGLVKSIDQLVRTSAGVGAFLCLAGVVLCVTGFWMLSTL